METIPIPENHDFQSGSGEIAVFRDGITLKMIGHLNINIYACYEKFNYMVPGFNGLPAGFL